MTVGKYWMAGCTALEQIRITVKVPLLKEVGWLFLSDCSKLKQAVFEDLPALTTVKRPPLFPPPSG